MKQLLVFMVTLALCLGARAGELFFNTPPGRVLIYTNAVVSSNYTASTVFTNAITTFPAVNHSFALTYLAYGTNAATVGVDRTLDGANWTTVASLTLTGTNAWSTNIVDVAGQYQFRCAVYTTNGTLTVMYAGK